MEKEMIERLALLEAEVANIKETIKGHGRTNWGVIISGVGTFIVVITLYLRPFADTQREIKKSVSGVSGAFHKHIVDGHPTRVEKRLEDFQGQYYRFATFTHGRIDRIEEAQRRIGGWSTTTRKK